MAKNNVGQSNRRQKNQTPQKVFKYFHRFSPGKEGEEVKKEKLKIKQNFPCLPK